MASKHKKAQKGNTVAIPVRELAMVAIFCLWNVIFFVWIIPGDGMFLIPQDGEIVDDYPHGSNSIVLGLLWGMWIVQCVPIVKSLIHCVAIVASHLTGVLYITVIVVDQTRSQAACLWPPCGL